VQKQQDVGWTGYSAGIHLGRAASGSDKGQIGMGACDVQGFIAAAAIDDNHACTTGPEALQCR